MGVINNIIDHEFEMSQKLSRKFYKGDQRFAGDLKSLQNTQLI